MVDADTASVLATLTANVYVGLACLVVFEYFRRKEPEIYAPRLRSMKGVVTIDPPSKSIFGWAHQVYHVSDETLLRSVGLDAYVFLRILRLCAIVGIGCSFIGLMVLVPVYYTAYGDPDVNGIAKFSMANIKAGGIRLWCSFSAAYLFTGFFLYLSYKEYENFATVRQKVLTEGDYSIPLQVGFSVQVENIPKEYCSSPKLQALFESLFPGEVALANICIAAQPLADKCAERKQNLADLEVAIAAYEATTDPMKKERPVLKLRKGKPTLCPCGALGDGEVDAIDFGMDQVSILNEEIAALQKDICQLEENGSEPPVVDIERGRGSRNKPKRSSAGGGGSGGSSSVGGAGGGGAGDTNSSYSSSVLEGDDERASSSNQSQSTGRGSTSSSKNSAAVITAIQDANPPPKSSFKKEISGHLSKAATAAASVLGNSSITVKNVTTTGFVTFKTRRVQAIACQMPILSAEFPKMTVEPAPEPSDVIWANIQRTPEEIQYKAYFTSLGFYYGLLFWGTVLTCIAAISNLKNLESFFPILKKLDSSTYALLQGLLPVVVMLLFFSYLSAIIASIVRYVEGRKTESGVQMLTFQWYFMYQLANVYLLLLAGSVFDSLKDAIDDPTSIIYLIGAALPSVSVFFMNYIITQLFAGVILQLLRPGPLIIFKLYRTLFDQRKLTRRTVVEGPLADENPNYGQMMMPSMYLLVIMLLYWVIAPLILIAATFLFCASYISFKYQYLYVFKRKFESNGRFFYVLYHNCMVTLLSSSVLLIAYVAIKLGVLEAPLLLPLPVFIIYVWRLTERNFCALSMHFPYSSALEADIPLMSVKSGWEGQKAPASSSSSAAAAEGVEESLLSADILSTNPTSSRDSYSASPYSFSTDFLRQPELLEAVYPTPYPYRIRDIPLFNDKDDTLNEVYHDEAWDASKPVGYEAPRHSVDSTASNQGSINNPHMGDTDDEEEGKKKGVKGFVKSIFHSK